MQTDCRDRSRFIAVVRGCSLRPFGRIALFVCAAGCLAACTEVVDVTTDSRYAQYNRSTDWAKNEAILLNIARASLFQPLNFLIYNAYSGSATVSAAASSPAFVIGPSRVASQKQYSFGQGSLTANAMANGSISVQNLDTQDFYDSLLAPVEYKDLYAFQRQGYPRELLFRLFADYVSIKPGTGDSQGKYSAIVYNSTSEEHSCFPLQNDTVMKLYGPAPRDDQTRICFKDLVIFALASGLSSEIRTVTPPPGGGGQGTTGAVAAGAKTSSSGNSTPPKPQIEGRLCFDTALAARAYLDFKDSNLLDKIPTLAQLRSTQYQPVCGGYWPPDSALKTSTTASPAATAQKDRQAATAAQAKAEKAQTDADASPNDTSKANVAQQAKLDAATANAKATASEAKAANAPAKPAAPSAPPAQGKTPSPGVATLSVHVSGVTGHPIWDIHILGQHVIEIGTRSTFSIYNFLGTLLRDPLSPANSWIGPPDDSGDPYILTVHVGQPAGC